MSENHTAGDIEGFEDLLHMAESNASTPWETTFCADIRKRFEQFQAHTYVSTKQLQILNRIAKVTA